MPTAMLFKKFVQRIQKIKSKSVLLLLAIQFLYFMNFNLYVFYLAIISEHFQESVGSILKISSIIATISMFYSLIGWIADTYTGRYKAIIFGNCISIFPFFFALSMYLVLNYSKSHIGALILGYLMIGLQTIGWSAITANLIQFITDQVYSTSGDELSAIIQWYTWIGYVAFFISSMLSCQLSKIVPSYTFIILGFICIVIALVIQCLGHKWIDTTPQIKNTIKSIFKVLNYARKHKTSVNRSATTFIDELHPSRIDLGKNKYGGPFTESEVEDVKTVLRLLPIIACMIVLGLWFEHRVYILFHMTKNSSESNCTIELLSQYIPGLVVIPLYQLIILPCCYKYVPWMLRKIGIGMLFIIV